MSNNVDEVARDFACSRATEEPYENNGKWIATIHKCNKNNTNCAIASFILNFFKEIQELNSLIKSLSVDEISEELKRILEQTENIIKSGKFKWEGNKCRRIGDLIIGLHSILGGKLVSSNYKEHQILTTVRLKFREYSLCN